MNIQIARGLRLSFVIGALVASLMLVACGGSGGGGTPPPPLVVSVAVAPGNANVVIPNTQTFTATVSNTTNTAVTWSIQEGNTGGSITAQGVYTPPNATGTFHVIATSGADSSKSATAAVVVSAPAPVVSSTPSTAASEGTAYSYTIAASDPANTGVTVTLTKSPTGATLTGNAVNWTPTHQQARTKADFTVHVVTGLNMSADQNWSVTPTGNVIVTGNVDHYTENGVVKVPFPADPETSGLLPTMLIPNATGGFDNVTATVQGNDFVFANVPAGYYWLQYWKVYTWTNSNIVDITQSRASRVGADFYTPLQTINLTGLLPSTTADLIQFYGANTMEHYSSQVLSAKPVGTTAVTFVKQSGHLLADPAKGDRVYVHQTTPTTVGGQVFKTIKATTGAMSITETYNPIVSQVFDFALTPVGQNSVFRANIKVSSCSAFASKVGPNSTEMGASFGVRSFPALNLDAYYSAWSAPLIQYSGTRITTDTDLGDVAYGNPYPNSWTPVLSYDCRFDISYSMAGASQPRMVSATSSVTTTQLPSATTPIGPVIGPVESPKLDGNALTAELTGVSLTPTLSWSAPSLGTADYYSLIINELGLAGTSVSMSTVGGMVQRGTNLRIPQSLLHSGKTYFLCITANSYPGADVETGISPTLTTYAYADFCSAKFTTQ